MKILVFGGSGQLGYDLLTRARDLNFEIVSPVPSEMDITEREQVMFLAKSTGPQIIINCAAYTAVDLAEERREEAFKVNRDGAANAAAAAAEIGARLIYISTDYVFDGGVRHPLKEDAATNPLNVYGLSKLAGERESLNILPERSLIVRTSSLFGQRGANFVRTMIELFKQRDLVKVVHDQYMSPTWSGWLAEVLLDLCRIEASGVVHACCSGTTTWFDFAKEIYRLVSPSLASSGLGRQVSIVPISAAKFGRPAKRPDYSVLDCSRLAGLLGRPPISWEEGLRLMIHELQLSDRQLFSAQSVGV